MVAIFLPEGLLTTGEFFANKEIFDRFCLYCSFGVEAIKQNPVFKINKVI